MDCDIKESWAFLPGATLLLILQYLYSYSSLPSKISEHSKIICVGVFRCRPRRVETQPAAG